MLLLRDQLRPREGQESFRRWPPAAGREGLRTRFEPSNGGGKASRARPSRTHNDDDSEGGPQWELTGLMRTEGCTCSPAYC